MKRLDVIPVPEKSIETMSEIITTAIDNVKDNVFFEGAYYEVYKEDYNSSKRPIVDLTFVYTDNNYFEIDDELSKEQSHDIIGATNIELRTKGIGITNCTLDRRKIERTENPIESTIRDGVILFDKNGTLAELKERSEIMSVLGYYTDNREDVREIEPPVKYLSKTI